jgi:hypothetical protein
MNFVNIIWALKGISKISWIRSESNSNVVISVSFNEPKTNSNLVLIYSEFGPNCRGQKYFATTKIRKFPDISLNFLTV